MTSSFASSRVSVLDSEILEGGPVAGMVNFNALLSEMEEVKIKNVISRKPRSTIGVMSILRDCSLYFFSCCPIDIICDIAADFFSRCNASYFPQ